MTQSESRRSAPISNNDSETEYNTKAPLRIAKIALQAAILVACIVYLVRGIEWAQLGDALTSYDVFWLTFAFVLTGLGALLLGIRLAVISRRSISVKKATAASIVCLALNAVLPAKLGEIAKIVYLSGNSDVSSGALASYVFWERFADINLLLVLACVSVYAMDLPIMLGPLLAATAIFWVAVLIVHYGADFIGRILSRSGIVSIIDLWNRASSEIRRNLKLRFVSGLAGTTTLIWIHSAVQAVAFLILAAALQITIAQALLVFLLSALSTLVPASPGNVGIFEASIVFGLSLFDVPKTEALAAGITLHLIYLIPAIIGGLGLMAATQARAYSLVSSAKQVKRAGSFEPADSSTLD